MPSHRRPPVSSDDTDPTQTLGGQALQQNLPLKPTGRGRARGGRHVGAHKTPPGVGAGHLAAPRWGDPTGGGAGPRQAGPEVAVGAGRLPQAVMPRVRCTEVSKGVNKGNGQGGRVEKRQGRLAGPQGPGSDSRRNWGTHGSLGLCEPLCSPAPPGPPGLSCYSSPSPPSVEKENLHPFPNKCPWAQETATQDHSLSRAQAGHNPVGPSPPAPPAPGPRDALGVWGPGGPRRCQRAPPSPRTPARGTSTHSPRVGRATRRECPVRTEAGVGGPQASWEG